MALPLPLIAKGLLTHVLPSALHNRSGGRTASARYCYSVFLRHSARLAAAGLPTAPRAVAELGPGASIGTGLAALVAGADRYRGFDIKSYGIGADAVALFDELVALFRARAPVPGEDELPRVRPELPDLSFPAAAFPDATLDAALDPGRLDALRGRLAAGGDGSPVHYAAPWFDRAAMTPGSIDWIFSQAVMEHVDDLDATYAACRDWLVPGGVMSHQIDFKSHGLATAWNGHWGYSETVWRMIRGGRAYLINRHPLSAHLAALARAGFDIVEIVPVVRTDGIGRDALAPRFNTLTDEDLVTAGAFVVARKPADEGSRPDRERSRETCETAAG